MRDGKICDNGNRRRAAWQGKNQRCEKCGFAVLAACLLTEEVCEIQNVPPLADVRHMAELLTELGARVEYDAAAEKMCVQATELTHVEGAYETARKMRASFLAAGALLARCGAARLPLPGGCQIGSRPIDLHLKGFHLMGAKSRQAAWDGGITGEGTQGQ